MEQNRGEEGSFSEQKMRRKAARIPLRQDLLVTSLSPVPANNSHHRAAEKLISPRFSGVRSSAESELAAGCRDLWFLHKINPWLLSSCSAPSLAALCTCVLQELKRDIKAAGGEPSACAGRGLP